MNNTVITVDGSSASGKSSLCQRLVSRWTNWDWLSTGVFYRGLAYMILDLGIKDESQWVSCLNTQNWKIQKKKDMTCFFYNEKDVTSKIYNANVDQMSSKAAASFAVRQSLIHYQREQKEEERGLIAEGRDCGTVIFQNALLKIYLTATDEVRAQRRARERNQNLDFVMDAQKQRDKNDSERLCNPLKKPEDAWIIHTDKYSLDEIEQMVDDKARLIFSHFI